LLTSRPSLPSSIPLVLDLDGTVIRTDTFHEMMAYLLMQKPLILLRLPFWFLKGRAYAKAQLVEHTDINVKHLPYNALLLSFAQQATEEGRPLILATGTDQKLAQKISDHLGIFQEVIGSDGVINMTGHQKRHALLDRFGIHGFDYAGDSPVDAIVWQVSREALVVYPKWGVLKKARALKDSELIHYIPREKARTLSFLLALRPLFWVFNLMMASMSLFIGFSLLVSGLLIVGDLVNLEKDRRRGLGQSVFAQGHLHLSTAFVLAPMLILLSFSFLFLSPGGLFLGAYIPLFIGLDRLTRCTPQLLRWILLGLFQILTAMLV